MQGRDTQGRFIKGNPGGPGRPPLDKEAALVEGIKAALTAETVAQILEKLTMLALAGNTKAAEIVLSYAVGKPQQFVDVTSDGRGFTGPVVYLPAVIEEAE